MLEIIAENIRAERARRGWSQKKLADECGIHINAIGMFERAQKNMRISSLKSVADALGFELGDICRRKQVFLKCDHDGRGPG